MMVADMTDPFSLTNDVIIAPDLESMELAIMNEVVGIEPLEVERFPASWRDFVQDRLVSLDGAVLLALRAVSKVAIDEVRSAWALSIDFVIIFKSHASEAGHVGGYRMIEAVIESLDQKAIIFGDVQYTMSTEGAQFIAQLDEHWIWNVRSSVRPTFSMR